MTIHKALCELKTLDSRIQKGIHNTTYGTFVLVNKHSNTKVGGSPIADVVATIQSEYQSVVDLMLRRDAIKRAVTMSNAVTKVQIGGVEYTVAEAIEMKNHGIPYKRALLTKLADDLRSAKRQCDTSNGEALEARADEYVKSLYGNSDMKGVADDVKKTREEFIKNQTLEILDPIDVKKEVEALTDFISTFTVEIDSALSVSNALTEVTVEY